MRPPDGSFGTRLANGTATGMVGMVGRQVSLRCSMATSFCLHTFITMIVMFLSPLLPHPSVGQEVDIGLGPFGITAARSKIVDYTSPVVNDYLRILAGRGRPEVDPWGFLLPLAPLVWAGLLIALVLLLAIVPLLARFAFLNPPALAPYVRVMLQESE